MYNRSHAVSNSKFNNQRERSRKNNRLNPSVFSSTFFVKKDDKINFSFFLPVLDTIAVELPEIDLIKETSTKQTSTNSSKKRRRKKVALPPQAIEKRRADMQKYNQNQNQLLIILIACMRESVHIVKSIDRKQLIVFFTLYFAAVSGVNALTNKMKTNNHSKDDIVSSFCTDVSKTTTNKPNISLGFDQKGNIAPASCIMGEIAECEKHYSLCRVFYNEKISSPQSIEYINEGKASALREKLNKEYNKWYQDFSFHLHKAGTGIVKKNKKAEEALFQTIAFLKSEFIWADLANEAKLGRCDEHAACALQALFKKKFEYNLEIKIQKIDVMDSKKKNGPLSGHTYLLIDSDISDINVEKDQRKTQEILNSITRGETCDPWNYGMYQLFASDKTQFYNGKDAPWDTIEVREVRFNFDDLKKLSMPVQRLYCKELSNMGLLVETTEPCKMFPTKASLKSNHNENVETAENKLDL